MEHEAVGHVDGVHLAFLALLGLAQRTQSFLGGLVSGMCRSRLDSFNTLDLELELQLVIRA